MKSYDVIEVRVEEFKSGENEGKKKPIKLPDDAIPLGAVGGFGLRVIALVPRKGGT